METEQGASGKEVIDLGKQRDLCLVLVKRPERNIGAVILQPDSAQLIVGVGIEVGTVHADDRGYFSELFRVGDSPLTRGLAQCSTLQISMATAYPGIIKALHYHFEQTDYWAPVQGMFQVVLCDLRADSPTHGEVNTLYVGTLRPWRLRIPPGIGHGYKVVGQEAATLIYLADRFYNPKDEGRVAYNHPFLNYDWEVQHK